MPEENVPTDPKFSYAPEDLEVIVAKVRKKPKLKPIAQATIKVLLVTSKKPMVRCVVTPRIDRDLHGVHAYVLVGSPTWELVTGTGDKKRKRELEAHLGKDVFAALCWVSWDGEKLYADRPDELHPAVVAEYGLEDEDVAANPLVKAIREKMQMQFDLDQEDEGDGDGVTDIGDLPAAAQ